MTSGTRMGLITSSWNIWKERHWHAGSKRERGRQVISQAKQTKVIQDVQETLVSGLSQFNDQLRKLVDRLESERTGQASGSTTQQVPIDDEHPATGETTKLDE